MGGERGDVEEFGDGFAGEGRFWNFFEDNASARRFAEGDGDEMTGFEVEVGGVG